MPRPSSSLAKGAPKRHRKGGATRTRPALSKSEIVRLARRGGVKRMSGTVYEEMRDVLRKFLENLIRDTVTYTEHSRRKTVIPMDVVMALKSSGSHTWSTILYGFEGQRHQHKERKVAAPPPPTEEEEAAVAEDELSGTTEEVVVAAEEPADATPDPLGEAESVGNIGEAAPVVEETPGAAAADALSTTTK